FKESIRLAPDYARPNWQLGNFLIRAGKINDGFVSIRQAAASDHLFVQNAIDLAWAIYPGNTSAIEQIVRPDNNSSRIALAHFYMKQGLANEAMRLYREAGGLSYIEERKILNELIAAHKFPEAYEVWLNSHRQVAESGNKGAGVLIDGGFEGMIGLDDPGFGWQIDRNQQGMKVTLDNELPHSGKRSLRVDWTGSNTPEYVPVQQLVLVNPNSNYRLKLSVRTKQVVSGGLPLVIVVDAGSGQFLGQTPLFSSGTTPWNDFGADFKTATNTQAVKIQLLRQNCSSGACPMFGNVWIDDFGLQNL
ncbi:MAG: tetratricopeptide repeat protein, partial [Pyrinomonadaceae bacterium]